MAGGSWEEDATPLDNHGDLQILNFVPGSEQLSMEMIG